MVGLLKLRVKELDLERSFKVPFYSITQIVALVITSVAFLAIIWFNIVLGGGVFDF